MFRRSKAAALVQSQLPLTTKTKTKTRTKTIQTKNDHDGISNNGMTDNETCHHALESNANININASNNGNCTSSSNCSTKHKTRTLTKPVLMKMRVRLRLFLSTFNFFGGAHCVTLPSVALVIALTLAMAFGVIGSIARSSQSSSNSSSISNASLRPSNGNERAKSGVPIETTPAITNTNINTDIDTIAMGSIHNIHGQEQNENQKQGAQLSASSSSSLSLFSSIIKRRQGTSDNNINNPSTSTSWKVVDFNNQPITPEEERNFRCDFVNYTIKSIGQTVPMCVHTFPDTVSNHIRKYEKWDDCFNLPHLWNGRRHTTTSTNSNTGKEFYIEVGANIGSCVLEMLLATDALIIAFEPHPMNLYNLKKTILNLDKYFEIDHENNKNSNNEKNHRKNEKGKQMKYRYRDRIALFPIGLGNTNGASSTIYSASDNMGNSVLDTIVKDFQKQSFNDTFQFNVPVERMDSVLDFNSDGETRNGHGEGNTNGDVGVDVKLLKVDAQGYECKVFDGMVGNNYDNDNHTDNHTTNTMNILADKVDFIKFEYASRWLDPQNCTDELLPKLRHHGFDIYGKLFRKAGFRKLIGNHPDQGIKRSTKISEKGFDLVAMKTPDVNRNIRINADPTVVNDMIV